MNKKSRGIRKEVNDFLLSHTSHEGRIVLPIVCVGAVLLLLFILLPEFFNPKFSDPTKVPIPEYGHWHADVIILTIFIMVIVVIVAIFWKKIENFGDKKLLHVCMGIFATILVIALLEKLYGPSLNIFAYSNFVSLVGIVGIIATMVGLAITYKQVTLSEDRIDSFVKFYEWLNHILDYDMKNLTKKPKLFASYRIQFYGGTLIPGHISYAGGRIKYVDGKINGNEHIEKYIELLKKFAEKLNDRFEMILPSDELLEYSYTPYGKKDGSIDNDMDKKIKNSIEVVKKLKKDIEKIGGKIFEVNSSAELWLIQHYYLSIGNRVIYASSLYYQNYSANLTHKSLDERGDKPLLGFVTTNSKMVEKSRDVFDELKVKFAEPLKFMYSRHLVDEAYINKHLKAKGDNYSIDNVGDIEYLYPIDQGHISGLEGTKICIDKININKDDHVLDIGGGIGGTARYIAREKNAHVDSIEIQKDRYELSQRLTINTASSAKVNNIHGDFTTYSFKKQLYTKIIAFSTILHIKDESKDKAIKIISDLLKPGGMVYIEDYYRNKELTTDDKKKLLKTMSCPGLLTMNEYLQKLRSKSIDIKDSDVEDLTEKWIVLARDRLNILQKERKNDIKFYGNENRVRREIEFAEDVLDLFETGVIHGIRIVGKKVEN